MNTQTDFGLSWSKSRIVMTSRGEREVSSASATPAFWDAWRADKVALKERGFSCGKDDSGKWQVTLWRETMSTAARVEASEASRAATSEIMVPVPEGKEMYPFQRAGIAYVLARWGMI